MRAVLEVNLVAHVHPQTNRAPEAFNACSRQDRRRRVTGGYVTDRTREAARPRLVRDAEIDQPGFEGSKQAEWPPTGADLGAEQCMDGVQSRADKLCRHAVRKRTAEVPIEVVGHLGFDLHAAAHVQRGPPAYTADINL